MLRQQSPSQARRGRDAHAGSSAAPVEGDRDGTGKFSCRDCEKISQAPAPFHAIPRGWAGPSLLAMIMFEKFGQHQTLSFTLFLEDGRVCLSNNAAERGLRGIALGRKSWLFCGSDRGGRRAAAMYSLIVTAKMNGVDPQG